MDKKPTVAFFAKSLQVDKCSTLAGQKTSARPPDGYSPILDEWIYQSTCPMGQSSLKNKKDVLFY